MYSAPRYSMIKKHVELGETLDSTASRSMPTSPLGLLSLPCLHTQTGGQLRVPLYVIKGCSRSSMTKPHYFEVGLKITRCKPDWMSRPDHVRKLYRRRRGCLTCGRSNITTGNAASRK